MSLKDPETWGQPVWTMIGVAALIAYRPACLDDDRRCRTHCLLPALRRPCEEPKGLPLLGRDLRRSHVPSSLLPLFPSRKFARNDD